MKRALVMTLLLTSTVAWSADEHDMYWAQGSMGCSTFVERQKYETKAIEDRAWISGYLAAYNRLMPDTYDVLGDSDMKGATVWLENYCKEYPLKGLAEGMADLTTKLYPRRHKTKKEAELSVR